MLVCSVPEADLRQTKRLQHGYIKRPGDLSLWRDGGLAMINFLGCSAQGIAVANGVTTLALLEHMVERKF